MPDTVSQKPSTGASLILPLLLTVVLGIVLVALLAFTANIEEEGRVGFLAPYKGLLSIALVAVLGLSAVQAGSTCVFAIAQKRMAPDIAGAMRVITRLVGYGLIFSFSVSLLTSNPTAALTMGSFAGLVAGFAAQTVLGNTVAGVFLAITRPIGLQDRVTVNGNSGTVADITLMHIVLDNDDHQILIPSSTVVSAVLIKYKTASTP